MEWLLRIRTWLIRFPEKDPTQILVDNYTEAQLQAEQRLQKANNQQSIAFPVKCNSVLIAIPFKDKSSVTNQCLTSLLKQNIDHLEITIVLIDNNSTEKHTMDWLKKIPKQPKPHIKIVTLTIAQAFNFSFLINESVRKYAKSNTDWLLILNNDTEMRSTDDLQKLITFANHCPNLGALGCTLLYPNNKIQHLFAAPGQKIVAGHPLKGTPYNENHIWFRQPRPVAAVTGACQLISYNNFVKVGMLDEQLPTLGQDIDLCLKLQQMGLSNWVLPDVVLYHHEGLTKGHTFNKIEIQRVYETWGNTLYYNDYYSKKFTRWSEHPVYGLVERRYPWDGTIKRKSVL